MYYILYNPTAGGTTEPQNLKIPERILNGPCEFHDLTEIKDVRSFAAGLSGEDTVIICGGDGTLNRFINDVEGAELAAEVLYYGCGSGNDFLRDLDKSNAEEPFDLKRYIRDLPTVTVNGKSYRFLNGIGYGIDGYCCEEGDKLRAKKHKAPNYTAIAIKGLLFHFKPRRARVTVDGKSYDYKKVWIAATMKGRYYGGGMMITPEQDRAGDGVSLGIWHSSGRFRTLINFSSIFTGKHVRKRKMFSIHEGHRVTVEFNVPTALQIDGETIPQVTSYSVSA